MRNLRLSRTAFLLALAAALWSAAPAQGQKLLRWKFHAGDKATLVMTMEMQTKVTMQEKPATMTTTSTMDMTTETLAVDDQGVASLRQTFDRVRMKMQGPQGVMMEYDSQSGKKPEGIAAMIAPMLEAMVGKPLTTKMDARGRVLEVKLPEGLKESVGKMPGGGMVGEMFTPEGVKQMAEVALLPEQVVRPGDTWACKAGMKNPMLGDLKMETTFRYLGTERRGGKELEKIGMEIVMQFGADKMQLGGGQEAMVKITAQKNQGTMYFDAEAGRFVESESKSTMAMQISVLGQKIDQEIETTTKAQWKPLEGAKPAGP